jgi:hypothetical protein
VLASSLLVLSLLALSAGVSPATAAFERPPLGARDAGLAAFAPTKLGRKPLRAAAPDSSRGERHGWTANVSAHELFGLPEARGFGVSLTRHGVVACELEVSSFGSSIYRERSFVVGSTVRTEGGSEVALAARALGLSAVGLDDEWTVAVDAGLDTELIGSVGVGCHLRNLGGAAIRETRLPSTCSVTMRVGGDPLKMIGTTLIEPGFRPALSLGIEAGLTRALAIRAGSSLIPVVFAAGFGVSAPFGSTRGRLVTVDVAWQWHPALGGSSFVSVSLCGSSHSAAHGGDSVHAPGLRSRGSDGSERELRILGERR